LRRPASKTSSPLSSFQERLHGRRAIFDPIRHGFAAPALQPPIHLAERDTFPPVGKEEDGTQYDWIRRAEDTRYHASLWVTNALCIAENASSRDGRVSGSDDRWA
jgi:hypothetical protein